MTAVYSGDSNVTGSTSSVLTQNVLRKTTTVVTSNRTPTANLGQTVTFDRPGSSGDRHWRAEWIRDVHDRRNDR